MSSPFRFKKVWSVISIMNVGQIYYKMLTKKNSPTQSKDSVWFWLLKLFIVCLHRECPIS